MAVNDNTVGDTPMDNLNLEESWETFFYHLSNIIEKWEENEVLDTELDSIYIQLDTSLSTLNIIIQALSDSEILHADEEFLGIYEELKEFKFIIATQVLPQIERRSDTCLNNISLRASLQADEISLASPYNRRGRPQILIDIEQVIHLRCLGFKWKDIAFLFGISVRTLHRRRKQSNIGDLISFAEISDDEICAQLVAMKKEFPDIGERMAMGLFRSKGIFIPRRKIRKAFHIVDPVNTSLRWHLKLKRRVYSVPGPMSLWHIDGNHKLIRYGLVIHGGIDGFSRLIVFLRCSDNNRSETVANSFLEAVKKYNIPSRIRCDKGGENVRVAELMLQWRGTNRNSVLVGPSTHNQRIERLWRDLFDAVIQLYYRLFYHLEMCDLLNPQNEVDLFCLHYAFLPRINRALDQFVGGWNNHPMSGCHGQSPLYMFTKGLMTLNIHSLPAIDFLNDIQPTEYGCCDSEESTPEFSQVQVPKVTNPLSVSDFYLLQSKINPLEYNSVNNGIDLYNEVSQFVLSRINY